MLDRVRAAAALAGAMALSLLTSAGASTGAMPRPFPLPGTPTARRVPADDGRNAAPPSAASLPDKPPTPEPLSVVVQTALELRGTRYRNGGADPRGFDCSGFTQYVFGVAGAALPREVREQFQVGVPVEPGRQQPGDLIFFSTTAPGASHVGIALGGDGFVHAPSSRGVVRVERLDVPYWSNRLVGIRRVAAN